MSEHKLCPWCGSIGKAYINRATNRWSISCAADDSDYHGAEGVADDWCPAELKTPWCVTEEEAWHLWDNRVAVDVPELRGVHSGYKKELAEVEQLLGKALKYPWYKDDKKNFPEATEVDGVCVGEHAPSTIAAEAAQRIEKLTTALRDRAGWEYQSGCAHRSDLEHCCCRQCIDERIKTLLEDNK